MLFRYVALSPSNYNYCSCFPHVVNVAVQAIVKELKDDPYRPLIEFTTTSQEEQIQLQAYVDALADDPVGQACELVNACRASGQRRADLLFYIQEGNKDYSWGVNAQGEIIQLPVMQLLRDCPTRWSSTYMMGNRLVVIYPVSSHVKTIKMMLILK
jgi:hypothetical protein